ncbi:MAG: hypothetical protein HQK49_10505 [Oligoflexia bacterium]|nr:hypothetical protein [Oligoflexia bacterium]
MIKARLFVVVWILMIVFCNVSSKTFAEEKGSKDANDLIKRFDISTYHPEVYGLKDLVVDVRFTNLDKELSNQLGQLKIDDLYFTIYWISSGKIDVEISGLPKGFVMVKDTLIRSVQPYIEFIIPKNFAERARNYNLKSIAIDAKNKQSSKLSNGERLFIGTDKTHLNMVHEIKIVFDDKDRLNKLLMITPQGTEDAYYSWDREKWGQNKWVLSSIVMKSDYGIQSKIVQNEITYNSFSGIGLPVRVAVSTEIFSKNLEGNNINNNNSNKNKKKEDGTSDSGTDTIYKVQRDIIFSNYRINNGEAQKYFLKKM